VSARAWDGRLYSDIDRIVVHIVNHDREIFAVLAEHPALTAVLAFLGISGASLVAWWRRFGPMGSLR